MNDEKIPYSCPSINNIQVIINNLQYDRKQHVYTDLESSLDEIDSLLEDIRAINTALRDNQK
jgi:hypothetical protein